MAHANYDKAGIEIYLLFKNQSGSFSGVSGYLKRKDATKLSRQINPSDERRDNPYTEVLEIQRALMEFSPELEEAVWQILERERGRHRADAPAGKIQIAELINEIFLELGDVVFANNVGASAEEAEKEAFELNQVTRKLYEKIKQIRIAGTGGFIN